MALKKIITHGERIRKWNEEKQGNFLEIIINRNPQFYPIHSKPSPLSLDGHPCSWLVVPTTKPTADFHRLVIAHAGRTYKKGRLNACLFIYYFSSLYFINIYPTYKNNKVAITSIVSDIFAKSSISIDITDFMIAIMQINPIMINTIPTIFNNLFLNSNY